MSPRRAPQLLQGQGCAVALGFVACHQARVCCLLNPRSCGWRLAAKSPVSPAWQSASWLLGWGPGVHPPRGWRGCNAAKGGCPCSPPGLADRPQMRADVEGCLDPSGSAGICLGLPSGPTKAGCQVAPPEILGDWLVLKTYK